jgi:Mn2+/Fe2+ NRAMP family transporter
MIESPNTFKMKKNSAILGAAFLMATSAIGPGFLTQTARFTADLTTSFGFVILISLLLDIGAQLNIWRVVIVSGKRAQDLANMVLPGLGFALAILIGFGGLFFNIGNIAGCGLGINAIAGFDNITGAVLSCVIALAIFWYRDAGLLMDTFTKVLGLFMIVLTGYIAVVSRPPVAEAFYRSVWPEEVNMLHIITLVGGTVGGYISFAGAHRLVDAGLAGRTALPQVTRSAISGIVITSVMRFILFFATLGVVFNGGVLSATNPASSVFQIAAGNLGYRFFGFVMWSAAITSVVGASYTSVTFFKTLHPAIDKNQRVITSFFIIASTGIFIAVGNPVALLILAGAVNGLILPVALIVILIASVQAKIIGSYRHPWWMGALGWVIVVAMSYMGIAGISQGMSKFF